jgi:predicted phage gp36 major capsid-like protein
MTMKNPNGEPMEKKTRRRRTAEERLADLERQKLELIEKQKAALAKIEEQKERLANKKSVRKEDLENQKRFERAVRIVAPGLDHRHFIAILAEAMEIGVDQDALAQKGEALLEEHGKARRGRRPKSA